MLHASPREGLMQANTVWGRLIELTTTWDFSSFQIVHVYTLFNREVYIIVLGAVHSSYKVAFCKARRDNCDKLDLSEFIRHSAQTLACGCARKLDTSYCFVGFLSLAKFGLAHQLGCSWTETQSNKMYKVYLQMQ